MLCFVLLCRVTWLRTFPPLCSGWRTNPIWLPWTTPFRSHRRRFRAHLKSGKSNGFCSDSCFQWWLYFTFITLFYTRDICPIGNIGHHYLHCESDQLSIQTMRVCVSLFCSKFRLSYYPHCLESFKSLLMAGFHGKMEHSVYGDFKTYTPGQSEAPCYFIHVCKKTV